MASVTPPKIQQLAWQTVRCLCATTPKNVTKSEKERAKQNNIQQATKRITIHFYTTKYLTKR